jgi:hypothetical protein
MRQRRKFLCPHENQALFKSGDLAQLLSLAPKRGWHNILAAYLINAAAQPFSACKTPVSRPASRIYRC